jgi:hypothetical protein
VKFSRVDDAHHVVRHCSPAHFDNGALLATAFEPAGSSVSVNCVQFFSDLPDDQARLRKILSDLRTKPAKRTIRASHFLAELHVHRVSALKTREGMPLSVLYEDEEGDPSHCGIFGLQNVDDIERQALQQQLVASVLLPLHSVKDLDGK